MQLAEGLRQELRELLVGGNAHQQFDGAVRDFPLALRGLRPKGLPYSGWELLEHIRIAQHDILKFIRDQHYQSPAWPEGYWPATPAPPEAADWDRAIAAFHADRQAMLDLVADPERDMIKPFAHGSGQTLLREVLLAADHTAYHLGQFIAVRRLLACWPPQE